MLNLVNINVLAGFFSSRKQHQHNDHTKNDKITLHLYSSMSNSYTQVGQNGHGFSSFQIRKNTLLKQPNVYTMKFIYLLLILCLSLQNVMVLSESVKKTHLQKPHLGAKNPHLKAELKAKQPVLKARQPVLKAKKTELKTRQPVLKAKKLELKAKKPELRAKIAPNLQSQKPMLKDANQAHDHDDDAHDHDDDGLSTATIVFIVLGVLLVGVLGMVILKARKKNKKKGDKSYTIIEDQEQQINTLNF